MGSARNKSIPRAEPSDARQGRRLEARPRFRRRARRARAEPGVRVAVLGTRQAGAEPLHLLLRGYCAALERLGSCSPVRARPCHCRCTGSRRPSPASRPRLHPCDPEICRPAPLAPPAAPQPTARLRSRSASPVAACTVLVVLGQRGAAMHARSALCGREGDSDSS